jgi:hypothetical protein
MDLVKTLNEDPDSRLATLKDIRAQIIQTGGTHVVTGNLKRLIIALKSCLIPQPYVSIIVISCVFLALQKPSRVSLA